MDLKNYIDIDLNSSDEITAWSWWFLQALTQFFNLIVLSKIIASKNEKPSNYAHKQKWLCFVYTCACFIRAVWPRKNLDRQCFFNTFINTMVVGRTLATIGELCFISQMKHAFIALSKDLCKLGRGDPSTHKLIQDIASATWWFIVVAQTCCWICVTTGYTAWSAVEESIWTICFAFFWLSALYFRFLVISKNENLHREFKMSRILLNTFLFCTTIYLIFMITIDVPMYINLVSQYEKEGRKYISFVEGLITGTSCNKVSKKFSDWWTEARWQTPYFTFAVWVSLALAAMPYLFKPKNSIIANCKNEVDEYKKKSLFAEETGSDKVKED